MFNITINEDEFKRLIREAVREEVAAQIKEMYGNNIIQSVNDSKPYIRGIKALADFIGIGKSSALKLKNMGLIPFYQQPWSKIVLFDKEKVKAALQDNSEWKKICSRKKKSK